MRRLFLLASAAAFAVTALEVGLRTVGLDGEHRRLDPAVARFDDVLGWSPIGNLSTYEVHTTDDGRRGRTAVARKRQPGRGRVAVFGCERTFDVGVPDDDTHPARLERSLHDTETTICAERLLPEAACATSRPERASRTAS